MLISATDSATTRFGVVAVEWAVSVGLAVAKVALRLYGDQNLADMVEDVSGVRRIGRQPRAKDLGEVVAEQIEAALPEATRARMAADPEVGAAAEIAATVVAGLASKPEALAGALARSSDLLAYVRAHDSGARQQWVAQHAESVYDQVLAIATRQLVALAPRSGQARSAAMTEALQQLATITAQVQELLETSAARDAFVPLDAFKLGRLNPASVMNDRGPMAGRSSELNAAAEALDRGSATFRQLVVVTGPGGRGKSRLAIEALERHAQREPLVPIVCLSTARTFSPTMLHELRRGPLTVFIDDAHNDPPALAPLMSHVRNNRDIQLILATRPSGGPEIEQQISLALFSPAEHASIEVSQLELREARALVTST